MTTQQVFVVSVGEYDDASVDSIWTTEVKAQARFAELAAMDPQYGGTYPLQLERWPLDAVDADYLKGPGRQQYPGHFAVIRYWDGKNPQESYNGTENAYGEPLKTC